ncbi:hypothetical protein E2C01_076128 [Portunus trituberculatus]|uniref:Uncharacterized protein n=1 Tax=Portunus trituberculatus TaxID=210409 RepID=A0A5B7IJ00_PORTR|nr:hypothetical protein [Portunus trituberculatus]
MRGQKPSSTTPPLTPTHHPATQALHFTTYPHPYHHITTPIFSTTRSITSSRAELMSVPARSAPPYDLLRQVSGRRFVSRRSASTACQTREGF